MRLLAIVALTCLSACGSSEESTTIGGTTYTQQEDGTATISNENGSISATEGEAAANTKFPDFAPQYPGSTIESALVTNRDDGQRTMALLATSDGMDKVVEFYREKVTSAGLKVGMVHNIDGNGMLSAEAEGKKVSVTGGPQDGKTRFALTFTGE